MEGTDLNYLRKLIFNLLKISGPMSRREICMRLGIPWTTCYDNLYVLMKRGFVEKFSKPKLRGRPVVYWRIKNGSSGNVFY